MNRISPQVALDALSGPDPRLEPSVTLRTEWAEQVHAFAERFVSRLEDLPAYSEDQDSGRLSNASFPAEGQDLAEILGWLDEELIGSNINSASPRNFGYIPGSNTYAAALGDFLAAVLNNYAGAYAASPAASRIENALLHWIGELFGFGPGLGGTLTSGGSTASLVAVVTARETLDVADRHRAVLYVSEQSHHCIEKSAHVAGMGHAVRKVGTTEDLRLDPLALERAILEDLSEGRVPWMVASTAGTTNTGTVDSLPAIAAIARRYGIWHHVDAAYGGFFALTDEGRLRLAGIEQCDSLVVDPHKSLFMPYGLGAIIVRDGDAIRRAHGADAAYLQDLHESDTPMSASQQSAELSRHFRGLRMWLTIQLVGVDALRAALDEKILLARWFHEAFTADSRFEEGPAPDLSIAAFRLCPPQAAHDPELVERLNKDFVTRLQAQERVFLTTTILRNQTWIRMAVLAHTTHLSHVREARDVVVALADQVLADHGIGAETP